MKLSQFGLWLLLSQPLMFGCSEDSGLEQSFHEIKFTKTKLLVPRNYILNRLPGSLVRNEGLDVSAEQISLKVPLSEFDITIEKDTSLKSNVILLIGDSSNERGSLDVDNARSRKGLYRDAVIERDPVLNLHRVYAKAGFPKLWHYFRSDSITASGLGEWVGSCSVGPLETERSDLSNVKCTSSTTFKDVTIKYTTVAKYFATEFDVNSKIINKFAQWEVVN
ncbi:hypothetical protein [Pseudoalteromonas rubra]|uniref:hypothetical protein n=1 Tax=Pseudoalteromonas rubra TaxID=43658 RepID=UPI000F76F211|nr:hypothetical protein [Pseudoalteromonas rubra]